MGAPEGQGGGVLCEDKLHSQGTKSLMGKTRVNRMP